MSGNTRAILYAGLTGATLSGANGGTDSAAWDQLFFNVFTSTVTQTAAIGIESDAISITQTAAVPLESRLAVVQTAAEPLEANAPTVAQTAIGQLEARGPIVQTGRPNLEAAGAATTIATAQVLVEVQRERHSYTPAPRSYYESYGAPIVSAQIAIESKGSTITQAQVLPIAATEDPTEAFAIPIESRPHDATQSVQVPLEAHFGIATRRWVPLEEYGDIRSTGGATLVIEARGIPPGFAAVPVENKLRLAVPRAIPIELPRVGAHNTANTNVETRGFLQVAVSMPVEIERASVVVPLAPGAEDTLTVVRSAAESLIVKEALPLSES